VEDRADIVIVVVRFITILLLLVLIVVLQRIHEILVEAVQIRRRWFRQ
jgi:hypothetical protein